MIKEDIICAGFGGQGIMTLGKVIANAALEKGYYVTWLSSYGAEVRGGTAHAMVRISSEQIGNPRVNNPTTAIIMNSPSLNKFEEKILPGGLIVLNSSMKNRQVQRKDLEVIEFPFTDTAIELGNVKVANMIAAGIFDAGKELFGREILLKVIEKMASGREKIIPVNIKALDKGYEAASKKE
jgi:2-oxoglutarate ferredoxin oxidoreductase subunit gamma